MTKSSQDRTEVEIERLRKALDAETDRCRELQAQLDRARAEFEEFVSTAAHDLREPLRDVAAFSQLLAEGNAGRFDSDPGHFDPESGAFLERIRAGAARMQSLLADVVDYWSINVSGRQSSRTDMEAVLHQVLLSTAAPITERSATVTHDPLPSVWGDFDTLTKVLHHLIRNAIEYCNAASPRVHVSSTCQDLEWVFSVQDNGPGVDPAFQGRIFDAFGRLHGKELPGNGLGLAFCKKAIESQGGRMWMESTSGSGSTFYFTLPADA
jgi:light-regulated signal transduction histidine kinase (bacteriophytochrome)